MKIAGCMLGLVVAFALPVPAATAQPSPQFFTCQMRSADGRDSDSGWFALRTKSDGVTWEKFDRIIQEFTGNVWKGSVSLGTFVGADGKDKVRINLASGQIERDTWSNKLVGSCEPSEQPDDDF